MKSYFESLGTLCAPQSKPSDSQMLRASKDRKENEYVVNVLRQPYSSIIEYNGRAMLLWLSQG